MKTIAVWLIDNSSVLAHKDMGLLGKSKHAYDVLNDLDKKVDLETYYKYRGNQQSTSNNSN